ncbi:MAG: hypothetical protein HYW48_01100 [Deltaproteobacteria bacterium]|nr:hypothetical protein [Deltaproteobacteria bacterium]
MSEVLKNEGNLEGSSIPTNISSYRNDKESAPEFIKPKKYLCFADAHKFAKSLNFKTRKEWRVYVKQGMAGRQAKPDNVPAHPDGIYRLKGWQGWKFWLGTANQGLGQSKSHPSQH